MVADFFRCDIYADVLMTANLCLSTQHNGNTCNISTYGNNVIFVNAVSKVCPD